MGRNPRLSRAGLSVRKDCTIVPRQHLVEDWLYDVRVEHGLVGLLAKDIVKVVQLARGRVILFALQVGQEERRRCA